MMAKLQTMRIACFLMLLFSCCFVAQAQQPHFTHLTTNNGLTQNSIMSICQDGYGFMWFGTSYGLNRYDGHAMRTYKGTNGNGDISNTFITSLHSDTKKTLWVGTRHGLNRYNTILDSFEHVYFKPYTKDTKWGNSINAIYEDSRQNIWIGTRSGLQLLTNRDNLLFKSFYQIGNSPNKISDDIRSIFEDSNGYLWIGSSQGLIKATLVGQELKIVEQFFFTPTGLSNSYITCIAEDAYKNIWIGTKNGGINVYKSGIGINPFNKGALISTELNSIRSIIRTNTGFIWAGTLNGLVIIDPASNKYDIYRHDEENVKSLSNNSIHSVYMDAKENIWVGTYYGGLNFYNDKGTLFNIHKKNKIQTDINNDVIIAIEEDEKENLWLATGGGGLNLYNRKTEKFTYFQNNIADDASISADLVTVVYKDHLNNLWAGTYGGGLNLYVPSTNTFERFFYKKNDAATLVSEITSLLQDNAERYWIGFNDGLYIYNFINKRFTASDIVVPDFIENKIIKSLYQDKAKNVWVGTSCGLFILKSGTSNFLKVQCAGITATQHINCIKQDADGNIWIGLFDGGLALYNAESNSIKLFTTEDGLCNNNVVGIQEDNNNNLWITTDNGLAKFNKQSHNFKTYTTSDGLASNIFKPKAFLKAINGELYLGGVGGLTNFNPDKIKNDKPLAAPIAITGFHIFNEQVKINDIRGVLKKDIFFTDNISVTHSQNIFSIDFSLLNFSNPENNRYAYKLEGVDKDWNYQTTNRVTYNNLMAGNYVFIVKGSNNDGIWSNSVTLKIKVLPPFWKTWWAYFLYTLLALAAVYAIARYFFTQALFKRDSLHTKMKLNFFTNISHEIRTHLSLIEGPVNQLLLIKRDDEHEQLLLQTIRKNSSSLLQLVNEQMDFRKAETGNLPLSVSNYNIVNFVQSIYSSFKEMSVYRNINFQLTAFLDIIELYFDKEQLEKVLYNLLINAFKFTPNGGNISIDISDMGASVKIQVVDDGKGIAPENINKLFDNYFQEADYGKQNTGYGIGLALSKSIVALHHGTLNASSEINKQSHANTTSFTVTLLKGKKHFADADILQKDLMIETHFNEPPFQHDVLKENFETEIVDSATKQTLLLVEDNDGIRSFIKDDLIKYYNIIETNNGLDGWIKASELIPDLIISDIMMPEMDGIELCKKIKTDVRTSHIPVILLTAKSGASNHVTGLQTGADIYLTKPFNMQVLGLQINNLLLLATRASSYLRNKVGLNAIDYITDVALEDVSAISKEVKLNPIDEAFTLQVLQLIEEYMEDPDFNITVLCKKIGMSKPVLYKKIKAITDLSVNDFLKSIRLKKAAELLAQKQFTVYEVAYLVGYQDSRYFSKEFTKQFGVKPSDYKASNL